VLLRKSLDRLKAADGKLVFSCVFHGKSIKEKSEKKSQSSVFKKTGFPH
jgi:hypothetical protein